MLDGAIRRNENTPQNAWRPGVVHAMTFVHGGDSPDFAPDEALAEQIRTGGDAAAAFTAIVARYRGRITALARRLLVGAGVDEADDVAQEVFVAVYRNRRTLRPGEPFRPWLYRIAVNRCVDRMRAAARRPAPAALASTSEPRSEQGDPLESVLADEREARLQAAVEALPAPYRTVFVLRHVDDLSYQEIASATGLPESTVKTHLFRARARLRSALTGYLE
jgi:RNA polymerase sigma-70 factor (ECF subfamily)